MDKVVEVLHKNGKTIGIISLVLLVLFGLWYCFRGLSDIGVPADTVREDIYRAREGQSTSTGRADTIERGLTDSARSVKELRDEAGRASGAIDHVTVRNNSAKDILERGERCIAEGRRIIESIRTQGTGATESK